jgi:hypothetical protein
MPGQITEFSGTVPALNQTQPEFDQNTQDFIDYMANLAPELNEFAEELNSISTTTASTSSVAIGTGTKNFTVETGKSLFVGMSYKMANDANNWMLGDIISYNSGTGALSIDVDTVRGSGTYAAWVGTLSFNGQIEAAQIANDAVLARALSDSAIASAPILNGYIDWSISGSALTAAVKTLAGSNPSATDPVYAVFRDPTLGNAGYYVRAITAALSITAPDTALLGTVSAQASRIHAAFIDNGGTVDIGLYNSWDNTNKSLLGIDESAVYTTAAIGTGSDSAQVIYANSVLTSKAVRAVAYVDSTQTIAGTWAQTLDRKVTVGTGSRKTGEIIHKKSSSTGAVATGTTIMPFDDTVPQITEGTEFMTISITPTNPTSILEIELTAFMACSISERIASAIFQDAIAGALVAAVTLSPSTNGSSEHVYSVRLQANTTSAITFRFRAGPASAATVTFNGSAGGRIFGGVMASSLRVTEYAA